MYTPSNNATCVEEGSAAAAQAPIKLTCEQCFTKFLKPEQTGSFVAKLDLRSLAVLCEEFQLGRLSERQVIQTLSENVQGGPVNPTIINELIVCLKNAGIHFPAFP
jgi:hypothetical protein